MKRYKPIPKTPQEYQAAQKICGIQIGDKVLIIGTNASDTQIRTLGINWDPRKRLAIGQTCKVLGRQSSTGILLKLQPDPITKRTDTERYYPYFMLKKVNP